MPPPTTTQCRFKGGGHWVQRAKCRQADLVTPQYRPSRRQRFYLPGFIRGPASIGPLRRPPSAPSSSVAGGRRRGRDSNPRYPVKGTHAFQACLFVHSSTSPRCGRRNLDPLARKAADPMGRPSGGEGGIRTRDAIARILVFETSALSRSATSPRPARMPIRKRPAATEL